MQLSAHLSWGSLFLRRLPQEKILTYEGGREDLLSGSAGPQGASSHTPLLWGPWHRPARLLVNP